MTTNSDKFQMAFTQSMTENFPGLPEKTLKYLITMTIYGILNDHKSVKIDTPTFRQTANILGIENSIEAYAEFLGVERQAIQEWPSQIRVAQAKGFLKRMEEIEKRQAKALGSSKDYYDPEEVIDKQMAKMFKERTAEREAEKAKNHSQDNSKETSPSALQLNPSFLESVNLTEEKQKEIYNEALLATAINIRNLTKQKRDNRH